MSDGPEGRIGPYFVALAGTGILLWAAAVSVPGQRLLGMLGGFVPWTLLAALTIALWRFGKGNAADEVGRGGAWRQSLLLPLCLGLPLLSVLVCWAEGGTYYAYVGGAIPISDASNFYQGAVELREQGTLSSWNQRRPLNAALFAFRLGAAGGSFWLAMLMQALLFGLSSFLAARAVACSLGRPAGWLVFFFLFGFAARYLPTTLSESLGLTLGTLAFVLLWEGVEKRREWWFAAGLFMLTLALLARAGAMFTLPALMVFAISFLRPARSSAVRSAAVMVLAVAAGWMVNKSLIWIYGSAQGGVLSNFSYTLYGLAAGGTGWEQVLRDYPSILSGMDEGEQSRFIFQKAWDLVRSRPWLFGKAVLVGLVVEPARFVLQVVRLLVFHADGDPPVALSRVVLATAVALPPLLVGCVRWFRFHRRRLLARWILYWWAGFILSLPFFYRDGTVRSVAATFPLAAMTLSLGVLGWRKERSLQRGRPGSQWIAPAAAAMGFLLVVMAVFGPLVLPRPPGESATLPLCAEGEKPVRLRLGPGIPQVQVIGNAAGLPTFAPRVREEDYVKSKENSWWQFVRLPPGTNLALTYDLICGRIRRVLVPRRLLLEDRVVSGCVRSDPDGVADVLRVDP